MNTPISLQLSRAMTAEANRLYPGLSDQAALEKWIEETERGKQLYVQYRGAVAHAEMPSYDAR